MQADRVEVSWNEGSREWLIRIAVGEEVIRRNIKQPRDTDPATLQKEAMNVAAAEGYEVNRADVVIL